MSIKNPPFRSEPVTTHEKCILIEEDENGRPFVTESDCTVTRGGWVKPTAAALAAFRERKKLAAKSKRKKGRKAA